MICCDAASKRAAVRVLLLGSFVALTLVHAVDDLAARRLPRSTSAERVRQISTDTLTGGGRTPCDRGGA